VDRTDRGTPLEAIPLSGRWSFAEGTRGGGAHIADGGFTFACVGGALAKCVEFGYKPWRVVQGVSLAAHHQACTRMIRADYCGDGRSFTVDGRDINVYDALGIQADTEPWIFEAEWTPNGAACARGRRVLFKDGRTPACWSKLQRRRCGDKAHFARGTLLMNEYKQRILVEGHR
jgi:hypothetical protein